MTRCGRPMLSVRKDSFLATTRFFAKPPPPHRGVPNQPSDAAFLRHKQAILTGCYASLFNLSRPEMARAASRATRRPRVTRQLEELQNAAFDRLAAQQFPQHVRQHSAVPQVLDILGRVDSRQHLELRDLAILRRADLEHLAGLEPGGQPAYGKRLAAREP